MDGLLLKINYDFLQNLRKLGLEIYDLRVKELSRDATLTSRIFRSYADVDAFTSAYEDIIFSRRYLCSAGNFPVIENMRIINRNLSFDNSYAWYNITQERFYVQKISYDNQRKTIYEAQIKRYMTLMNRQIDTYTKNVKKAIDARLNTYVDPCYVDAGYISPN